MPRFLAITVAKLCSAILEVRLASYRLDVKILSFQDVKNLCTSFKLANMAASCGQFSCPYGIGGTYLEWQWPFSVTQYFLGLL